MEEFYQHFLKEFNKYKLGEKKFDKYLGCHMPLMVMKKGIQEAPEKAHKFNLKSMQFFLKRQLMWQSKLYTDEQITGFKENCIKYNIDPEYIVPHSGHLINLGNNSSIIKEKSINSLLHELEKCKQLGITKLNIHPGNAVNKISYEECIDLIATNLNYVFSQIQGVNIILETTAGQGTSVGKNFQQMKDIISKIEDKNRIGVCIDTCHIFVAGYDIRTEEGYKKTFDEFDELVGFNYLKSIHLNDTKQELGSKKDRHADIGAGQIGTKFYELFMNDSRFNFLPIIIEARPHEISYLYSLVKDNS